MTSGPSQKNAGKTKAVAAASPRTEVFAMKGITKRFPGVTALEDVSFTVHTGEVHCLVGENGAGKSTLMKIMSGVYSGYEGELFLRGEPVTLTDTRNAQDKGVAMIHQELNLIPGLSVFENIFLGREPKTRFGAVDRQRMRKEADALLSRLGLDIPSERLVSQLRVGQQQLVEIAKALSLDARVLIMDEPTSALSETEVRYLFGVIQTLRESGVAVIYISHRLDEIEKIADQVTVLRDGKVVGSFPLGELSRERMIHLMVGRELGNVYPKESFAVGERVFELSGLDYHNGRGQALRDVTLHAHKGEIVGIAGLMGAGRSELLEAIFGVFPRNRVSGQMRLYVHTGLPGSPKAAIREGIGLVAEDRKRQSLVLDLSVKKNMSLAALKRFLRPFGLVKQSKEVRAVEGVVDELSIKTPHVHTPVGHLSGGNQQKVVLGKFLLTDTKLLLLDEPTRGVDVGAKAEIYDLVGALAKKGMTFLVVSSELPELLAICDRIYVLCDGSVTGEFSREHFNQEAIMEAATAFSKDEASVKDEDKGVAA